MNKEGFNKNVSLGYIPEEMRKQSELNTFLPDILEDYLEETVSVKTWARRMLNILDTDQSSEKTGEL